MAFVSCRSCHWKQDDFWDEFYNPIRFLAERVEPHLLEPLPSHEDLAESSRKTMRDEVSARLLEAALIVLNMRWRTPGEYLSMNPDQVCPICGQQTLTVDE
jgi:hypothetical protein